MSTLSTNLSYAPVPPLPGEYLIKIVRYFEDHTYIFLDFDIAVGPSTGFAHIAFQRTGKWPLRWRICKSTGKSVIQHALAAINEYPPTIATLSDSVGRNICVKIGFSDTAHQYYQVCRSYPASHYVIRKSDILIGTTSWAAGHPDHVRANYLAYLSGLPILLADVHETSSPMVDWCADHQISLLPEKFAFGDYRIAGSNIVIDRKDNILELYGNFANPAKRLSYEHAAMLARNSDKKLIYVIGTSDTDHVQCIDDLVHWSAAIPKRGTNIANGENLRKCLLEHKLFFPHVDFLFLSRQNICSEIFDTLCDTAAKHIIN